MSNQGKIMKMVITEKGLEAVGWISGSVGVIGAAVIEWAPVSMPFVSSTGFAVGGIVVMAGFLGMALAFRGL